MNPKVVREIVIKIREDGHLSIWEGNRTTGQLTWGEVVEHVASVTHPNLQHGVYPLFTEEEWEQRWKPNSNA